MCFSGSLQRRRTDETPGGIAIFDSMNDFIKVHIQPHPSNRTIITYDDGEQEKFGLFNEEESAEDDKTID